MGKKNNKSGAQPMSPEKYIKEKARMLPLGKCYTYANWKDADEIMVIVTRIHPESWQKLLSTTRIKRMTGWWRYHMKWLTI